MIEQTTKKLKKIRLSPNIGEHDLRHKLKNAQKFITKGHRVQFDMYVGGRAVLLYDTKKLMKEMLAEFKVINIWEKGKSTYALVG